VAPLSLGLPHLHMDEVNDPEGDHYFQLILGKGVEDRIERSAVPFGFKARFLRHG
jgi:hypothetical protein